MLSLTFGYLCRRILNEGVRVENRTGIDTIKVPSHHFHFDLGEEFPVLTTKQLFIRQAVLEMLWFYQAQSNDVRWLQERDVKIWNEWEIDEEGDFPGIGIVIYRDDIQYKTVDNCIVSYEYSGYGVLVFCTMHI